MARKRNPGLELEMDGVYALFREWAATSPWRRLRRAVLRLLSLSRDADYIEYVVSEEAPIHLHWPEP